MAGDEPAADRVAGAGARTVAAGTARLFAAWSMGSPVPEAADRRCEGVADFATRRARVAQVVLLTARFAERFLDQHNDDDRFDNLQALAEPQQMIYDGSNAYLQVAGGWTGFPWVILAARGR